MGPSATNVTRLARSSSVKAADNFVLGGPFYSNFYGNLFDWEVGQSGFAGIRFKLGAETHYGWAQIFRDSDTALTLRSFGYNNTPGAASHPVPEPSSVMLLAAGAAGLAGWRQRRAT